MARVAAGRNRMLAAGVLALGVIALVLLSAVLSVQWPLWLPSPPAWRAAAGAVVAGLPWWLAMALVAVLVASLMADAGTDSGPDSGPGATDVDDPGDAQPRRQSDYWRRLSGRLLPSSLLTLGHGASAALILAWPLQWALATPSLASFLATAMAVLVIVLVPLALWPAPFLAALPRHADSVPGLRVDLRLRRAFLAARALTADPDSSGERGLAVLWLYSACLLLPVVAVLAGVRGGRLLLLLLPSMLAVAAFYSWSQRRLHASLDAATLLASADADSSAGADAAPAEPVLGAVPASARQRAVRLREAVRLGQVEQALALLAAGADASEPPWPDEADQRDAVIIAASLTDARPLRAMIAAGTDVNHRCQGITPLLAATRDAHYVGRVEIVLTLLANGARLDVQDEHGCSPLHHAALCADVSVAVMLLEAGANIDALDADGHTPLARAALAGNAGMVELLLQRRAALLPADGVPVLSAAAAATEDESACIERLLAAGAGVDVRDASARTPLHHAVASGHLAICRCLLAAGADANAGDDTGRTPLHLACASTDADSPIVRELLAAGADLDRADGQGVTPAMLSRARRQADADDGLGDAASTSAAGSAQAVASGAGADRGCGAIPGAIYGAVPAAGRDLVRLPPSMRAELALAAAGQGDRALLNRALALPLPADVSLPDGRDLVDAALAAWPASAALLAALPGAGVSLAGAGRLARLLQAMRDAPAQPDAEALALAWLSAGADPFAATVIGGNDDRAAGASAGQACSVAADAAATAPQADPETATDAAGSAAHDIHAPGRNTGSQVNSSRPLLLAVALGFERLAAALLELGTDSGQVDAGGRTALHWAVLRATFAANDADNGHSPASPDEQSGADTPQPSDPAAGLVPSLLRHGADPQAACICGETPLGLAVDGGQSALLPWLRWSGWQPPGRRLAGHDLVAAAQAGDLAAVERLLALGLPLEARDRSGGTALLQAAGHGHLAIATVLLERGADVDAAANSGNTPLVAAILGGHQQLLALLLAHGAVVGRPLAHGATALLVAAACGDVDACQHLLAAGAAIDGIDAAGNRALHAAASHALGSADGERVRQLLRSLLAAGADIDQRNQQGLTALHIACGAAATCRPDQSGIDAALDILLARAGAVQALDADGRSPLHYAAAHGQLQAVRRLVARGADVALADSQGWSPVDLAAHYGHTEVLQVLRATAAPSNLLLRPG